MAAASRVILVLVHSAERADSASRCPTALGGGDNVFICLLFFNMCVCVCFVCLYIHFFFVYAGAFFVSVSVCVFPCVRECKHICLCMFSLRVCLGGGVKAHPFT